MELLSRINTFKGDGGMVGGLLLTLVLLNK